MRIENQGRIKGISPPEGWVERQGQQEPLSARVVRSFHPPGAQDPQMRLVYRGRPVSAALAATFRQLLSLPPHMLGDEERLLILPLLSELADSRWFDFVEVKTIVVNGSTVVWAEGSFKREPFWLGGVLIAGGADGAIVQQVVLVARQSELEASRPLFAEILNSIEWQV